MANYKTHQYQMIIREHHLDTFHHVNKKIILTALEKLFIKKNDHALSPVSGVPHEKISMYPISKIIRHCELIYFHEVVLLGPASTFVAFCQIRSDNQNSSQQ